VFSGIVGLMLAPKHIHPLIGFVAILCIALSAGGSAAINMWYDRDIDAVMSRTKARPLPQGRIDPQTAAEFGGALIFFAVVLMALAVNALSAALLAPAALFYIFVYTMWLKRRTPQNIVIGGAAGAFPPMIGWAAATNHVNLPAFILFLIIFFWTPPHFWALALYRNDDYRKAGVPMMPVIWGAKRTKIDMLLYTLVLFPLSLAPAFIGMASKAYLIGATILSGIFVLAAARVLYDETYASARRMFGYSIFYLFALFSFLLADHMLGLIL